MTSLAAAALRDVLTTLARRNPAIAVIVYPVPVQGEGAADRIITMLKRAGRRAECDVLLLVRGGGSIEDLWQFNEEALARAIRACPIPVVVGVGHETDFTIADFAADRRAPTPTAAAEMASPAREELFKKISECARRLGRETQRKLQYAAQALDACARRLVHPAERLRSYQQLVTQFNARLAFAFSHKVHRCSTHAGTAAGKSRRPGSRPRCSRADTASRMTPQDTSFAPRRACAPATGSPPPSPKAESKAK